MILYFEFLISQKHQIEQGFFFNFFISIHLAVTNAIIFWRQPMRLFVLYHSEMGTSLSCDFVVSRFLIAFTSYMSIRTLLYTSVTWQTRNFILVCLIPHKLIVTIFLQIPKKRNKFDKSTSAIEPISMKSASCMFKFSVILEQ